LDIKTKHEKFSGCNSSELLKRSSKILTDRKRNLPSGTGFLSVSMFICLTAWSFLWRRERWGRESLPRLLPVRARSFKLTATTKMFVLHENAGIFAK
jgi:hypothetical protein